jgi:asparagine synthase (glutamine-hydrolysing)
LSNEKLTYQAFQRFKQDYQPKHLLFLRGNYQVVVRIGNRIWLFSDLGNVRPIYYSQQHNSFLFSSRLNLIHQHLNTPINIPWFQRALSTSGFHLETETPYKNIYVIPGGWGLLINQKEQKLFQVIQ